MRLQENDEWVHMEKVVASFLRLFGWRMDRWRKLSIEFSCHRLEEEESSERDRTRLSFTVDTFFRLLFSFLLLAVMTHRTIIGRRRRRIPLAMTGQHGLYENKEDWSHSISSGSKPENFTTPASDSDRAQERWEKYLVEYERPMSNTSLHHWTNCDDHQGSRRDEI